MNFVVLIVCIYTNIQLGPSHIQIRNSSNQSSCSFYIYCNFTKILGFHLFVLSGQGSQKHIAIITLTEFRLLCLEKKQTSKNYQWSVKQQLIKECLKTNGKSWLFSGNCSKVSGRWSMDGQRLEARQRPGHRKSMTWESRTTND